MADDVYKAITFKTDGGVALRLKLESPWVRTCGVAPNVNFARVRASEIEQIKDWKRVKGKVEFWFLSDAFGDEAAEVTLGEIHLVDAEPVTFDELPQKAGDGGGAGARGTVVVSEYRVALADRRCKFVLPSGGRLSLGEVNKDPPNGKGQDANGHDYLSSVQLVQTCLKAMGLPADIAPASLKDMAAPRDLQWRGAHAATELEKLLHATQHVMAVTQAGEFRIYKAGDALGPNVPAARRVIDHAYSAVERRGDVVVFSSAPNAILNTETISGVAAKAGDKGWEFVIQDKDGTWQRIEDTAWFANKDPLKEMAGGLTGVPEEFRYRVFMQLYRCIRLNPDTYGPAPINRWLTDAQDLRVVTTPIQVKAKIVVSVPGSPLYQNAKDFVRCNVAQFHASGGVIQTAEMLLKVKGSGPVADLNPVQVKLENDDLQVRVTRELYVKDAETGRWVPKYFYCGVQRTVGGDQILEDDAAENAMAAEGATVVRRPDLRLVRIDGEDVNRSALRNRASQYSPPFLAGSGTKAKKMIASGFVPAELNGYVNRVEYDHREGPVSTIELTMFVLPRDDYVTRAIRDEAQAPGELYPRQAVSAPQRLAEGLSGAVQPTAVVQTAPPPVLRPGVVKVKITGLGDGGGKYYGKVVGGNSTAADDDAWLSEPEGMTDGDNVDLLILNLFEDGPYTAHAGNLAQYKQNLPVGSYHLGRLVGGNDPGKIVEIESGLCGATNRVNIGHEDTTTEAPNKSESTEAANRNQVAITALMRVAYNEAGSKSLIGFFRTLYFECGVLVSVSAEDDKTIFLTAPCP